MQEAGFAVCGFIISGGDAPRVFELVEAALDAVSQAVDAPVNCNLPFAPAGYGNDGDAVSRLPVVADAVGVVAVVGDENFWLRPFGFHHDVIAFVVRDFAAGDFRRDREPFAVGAEMYLCRKAAF